MKSTKKYQDKFLENIIENLNKVDASKWENYTIPELAPQNLFTNREYSGFNILSIYIDMISQGHALPYYSTFKSIKDAGGKIKKGSKGVSIKFFRFSYQDPISKKFLSQKEIKKKTEEELKKYNIIPIPKIYYVFNISCIENFEELDISLPTIENQPELKENNLKNCDTFIKAIENHGNLKIKRNQFTSSAFYNKTEDYISIQKKSFFKSINHYYSTLFHEMIHWTGHPTRLNRTMDTYTANKINYSIEELIAEMGAMLLSLQHGNKELIINSIRYLKSWLNHTKEENHLEYLSEAFSKSKAAKKYLETIQNNSINTNKLAS